MLDGWAPHQPTAMAAITLRAPRVTQQADEKHFKKATRFIEDLRTRSNADFSTSKQSASPLFQHSLMKL